MSAPRLSIASTALLLAAATLSLGADLALEPELDQPIFSRPPRHPVKPTKDQELALSWQGGPAEPFNPKPYRDPNAPKNRSREEARRRRQIERLVAKRGRS